MEFIEDNTTKGPGKSHTLDNEEIDKKMVKLSHSISKIDTSLQTKKEILRNKISKSYKQIETTRKQVNDRRSGSGTPSPRINSRNRYSKSPKTNDINSKMKIQELEYKLEERNNELNMIKQLFNDEKAKLGRIISSQRLRIAKLEGGNRTLRKQLKEKSDNDSTPQPSINNDKYISSSNKFNKTNKSSSHSNNNIVNVKTSNKTTASPTKYIIIRKHIE
eukprot:g7747.t1